MEQESKENVKNWMEYEHQMSDCVIQNDWDQLEDLLMEDHPLIPGEKEAFEILAAHAGRPIRVELDDTGYHVIKVEDAVAEELTNL